MVTNHGVPESLMKAIIEASGEFFELTEEEKRGFEGKHVLDPIRYGTSFNASVDKILCWRDYLKIFQHPQFHSPNKPPVFRFLPPLALSLKQLLQCSSWYKFCLNAYGFREIVAEYSKKVGQVAREILRGVSESLGLEDDYIDKTLNLEHGRLQLRVPAAGTADTNSQLQTMFQI
ncbi:hypothetical protein GQ457_16G026660 [Hibiscus cannabinus]